LIVAATVRRRVHIANHDVPASVRPGRDARIIRARVRRAFERDVRRNCDRRWIRINDSDCLRAIGAVVAKIRGRPGSRYNERAAATRGNHIVVSYSRAAATIRRRRNSRGRRGGVSGTLQRAIGRNHQHGLSDIANRNCLHSANGVTAFVGGRPGARNDLGKSAAVRLRITVSNGRLAATVRGRRHSIRIRAGIGRAVQNPVGRNSQYRQRAVGHEHISRRGNNADVRPDHERKRVTLAACGTANDLHGRLIRRAGNCAVARNTP